MRLKIITLSILFSLGFAFSKNVDTLFVVKNQKITAKYSLKKDIDSLVFSQKSKKYSLDLFRKSKKVKSISVTDIDSIVFYNPFIEVDKISLKPTSLKLDVGFSTTLKATISPTNATNQNISWSSSNKKVLTVDKNGLLTGLKAGTAIVTVTAANSTTASCTVTVVLQDAGTFIDSRDGAKYNWTRIDGTIWLAENLKYLPQINLPAQYSSESPLYYVYDYDYDSQNVADAKTTYNYTRHGVLYNLPAALKACPEGWHLAGVDEWSDLMDFAGGPAASASKLKSTTGWSNNGTDEFGFSALPSGFYSYEDFCEIDQTASWHSAGNDEVPIYIAIDDEFFIATIDNQEEIEIAKSIGFSVRCIKGLIPLNFIDIDKNSVELDVNETQKLKVSAFPLHANENVIWSSSNNSIVTVDQQGLVRAQGEGEAYIIAQNADRTVKDSCYFKVSPLGTTTIIDARDNNTYKFVDIGEQTWLAENLRYLPAINNPYEYSVTEPHYYVYNYAGNNLNEVKGWDNYHTFGVFYNYPSTVNVCPAGWRLPVKEDIEELASYLADNGYNFDGSSGGKGAKIAKSLASKDYWVINPEEEEIVEMGAIALPTHLEYQNKSGFNALPSGFFNAEENTFGSIGLGAAWWLADVYSEYESGLYMLNSNAPLLGWSVDENVTF